MKQSLSFRLAALLASVVITALVFESVAELGHPVADGQVQVAQAAASSTLR